MKKLVLTAVVTAIITALAVVGAMALIGVDPNPAIVAGVTGGVTGAVAVTAGRKPKQTGADSASEKLPS